MSDDSDITLLWPERPTCHDHDPFAQSFEPSTWRPAGVRLHPDNDHVPAFRTCSYCGCMHPEDLHSAILAGAKLGGSDWKYGWPHKFYVDGIPNSNEGNLVTWASGSVGPMSKDQRDDYERQYTRSGGVMTWTPDPRGPGDGWKFVSRKPDDATTHGKWYNAHLNELNDVAFSALTSLLMRHAGIQFYRENGKLGYLAPRLGYQR